jgi:twinkle protein
MNVRDFADSYMQPYKEHGDELVAMYCPFCNGGRDRKDKWKFYLNKSKKTYICQRATCGKKGHFTELCKEFGQVADRDDDWQEPLRPVYKKPLPEKLPQYSSLDKVEAYLKKRGFSPATWQRRKVGESNGAIAMPYFENGEVVLVKYRPAQKVTDYGSKSWQSEGGKPVLWGMELCDPKYPLVIVEGEMDALALDECGVANVLSVPVGSSNLLWIENCWDFLKQYSEIIFWGDNDEPGKKMIRECQTRLSEWKLREVKTTYKDANAAMYAMQNNQEIALMVEMAPPMPISGLIDLADLDSDFDEDAGIIRVRSGMGRLDASIGGFALGEITIWTGDPGEGKSTFVGQVLLNSIKFRNSVCAYSGELRAKQFRHWLYLQAAGAENLIENVDPKTNFKTYRVRPEIAEKIREWHRGKLYLYDNRNDQAVNEKQIIPMFQKAANQYGCKVFLIDNLMTAQFEYGRDRDYFQAQGDFFRSISAFAQGHNVHVHVVAHPRKTQGKAMSGDDVAGAKALFNLTQNLIRVARGDKENTAKITLMKHRETGLKDVEFNYVFEPRCKRFCDTTEKIRFGWEDVPAPSLFDSIGIDVEGNF